VTDAVLVTWDGEALRPVGKRWKEAAQALFAHDGRYFMSEEKQRSHNSHSHYFASVSNAWKNLPEELAQEFPSSEHLRKWALVKAGLCDHYRIALKDELSASEAMAMVRKMDDYAIIRQRGDCMDVFTPQSQSYKAMGKEDFQDSKDKVLDIIAELIGTTKNTLVEASAKDTQ